MQVDESQALSSLRHSFRRYGAIALLLAVMVSLSQLSLYPATSQTQQGLNSDKAGEPGRKSDNKTLLINNWTITPAGQQTALGDLPLNAILSPDGHHMLVANGGAGVQSLQVVETANSRVIQTIPYLVPDSVLIGLAYSPDGTHAYASGGGRDVIHTYTVSKTGVLTRTGDIPDGTLKSNPFPIGLSISPDGATLYVANNLTNTVALINTKTRKVIANVAVGNSPYTTVATPDGKKVYISNWGDATLSVLDTASKKVTGTIQVGDHPSALAFGPSGLLFVTNSNSDSISVVDTSSDNELRQFSVSPNRGAPLSSTPEGLAVSPNGKFLYVALAGNNAVAVFGLDGLGSEKFLGRIPTAWYPTAVLVSKDGNSLFVTNGKGFGAGPNNKTGFTPNPARMKVPFLDVVDGYADAYCQCTFNNYSGSMIVGTLSTVQIPSQGRLRVYSAQVAVNNREKNSSNLERSPGNPIPLPGGSSPIKHVIYIIKENRTFDQVFGDESQADADRNLALFPRNNTPNIHALAERFGILDNFYADAEVSADGHNWVLSAYANEYDQKMWPQDYSPGDGRNRGYDFEGSSSLALSPGGYLWDAAAQAHLTYRDYGEFFQFDKNYPAKSGKLIPEAQANSCTGPIAHSYNDFTIPAGQVLCFLPMNINPNTTPNLAGHYDPRFRTFDMRYREAERIVEWQREFNGFIANNNLPQFEILRLPNDHTAGTSPKRLTPQAMVAENDLAVGKVVELVSHSNFWASTAIFVTEDDSQNGPDHVDAHRTTSLVISPYTSRPGVHVDHTLYDSAALIRTIELILGMRPLSQYDANAMPMWRSFHERADTTPYSAVPESIPPTQENRPSSYGAQQSQAMDFSQEDRMPMDALNHVLWYSIKGTQQPYPATENSGSSGTQKAGDD